MKCYVINEEELKDWFYKFIEWDSMQPKNYVNDFLADKQPIKEIGEVLIDDNNIDNVGYWFKGYKGKQIKIYIEVKE